MLSTRRRVVVVGGGQSGLAAAASASGAGLDVVLLEAGDRPAGSWPRYYDSLRLFSPAQFSRIDRDSMIGEDPDHYPTGHEVADHLAAYAAGLDADIRVRARVREVVSDGADGYLVHVEDDEPVPAAAVVAASGSFGNPVHPRFRGQDTYRGPIRHAVTYRNPLGLEGRRVVVVGAGNSAVQIAYELGRVAAVTLATRTPLTWMPLRHDGKDMHHWFRVLGFDDLPAAWIRQLVTTPLVVDDGHYRRAEADGVFDHRPMFDRLDDDHVVWADGRRERVDLILTATGYRPDLRYLRELGALGPDGLPQHEGGLSTTHRGLAYVGLDLQRTFASNTVRGVRADADWVMTALGAHVGHGAAVLAV